jgi:hypothetical protein
MEDTSRLVLPLLQPGQAQKELFHNEALLALDIAVQASVVEVGAIVPPAAPVAGQCWIVGDAPTGDWTGHAGALAGWTPGGWRFVGPCEGMVVWDTARSLPVRRVAGAWEAGEGRVSRVVIGGVPVVGPRGAAIPTPAGGTTVDGEARAAIAAILAAMRDHGLITA